MVSSRILDALGFAGASRTRHLKFCVPREPSLISRPIALERPSKSNASRISGSNADSGYPERDSVFSAGHTAQIAQVRRANPRGRPFKVSAKWYLAIALGEPTLRGNPLLIVPQNRFGAIWDET
jgi:hypothetical protein